MPSKFNVFEVIYFFTSSYEFALRYLADQSNNETLQSKAKASSEKLLDLLEWMEKEKLTPFID